MPWPGSGAALVTMIFCGASLGTLLHWRLHLPAAECCQSLPQAAITAAGSPSPSHPDWAAIASAGEWSGWGSSVADSLKLAPDYGPDQARPSHGVSLVGSGLWVTNYNVLLLTRELRRAQQISTLLSERGGGLLGVQAMALPHQDGALPVCCQHPAGVLNLIRASQCLGGLATNNQRCTFSPLSSIIPPAYEQLKPLILRCAAWL